MQFAAKHHSGRGSFATTIAAETPKRRPSHGRSRLPPKKRLFGSAEAAPAAELQPEAWSLEENRSLVEFILFSGDDVWPAYPRSSHFWVDAADFVNHGSMNRSGIKAACACVMM